MELDRRAVLAAGLALASRRALSQPAAAELPVDRLRSRIAGEVLTPGEEVFERARRAQNFNPTSDRRPRLIVRCRGAADVTQAVLFARENGLELAVRSGGNDVLGASTIEGGLLIDLSLMNGLAVDPKRRRARAEPGLMSGAFNVGAAPHGLAPVLGCNPSVGVGGLLLGGGIGWFLGVDGAACDQIRAVELVTAEGRMVRATTDENRELFWALRGGGGNFGVATAFECSLRPISTVLGGVIGFRAEPGPFLRFYRDFMARAPDPLAVELNLFAAAPTGPPMITAAVCWSGAPGEGEKVLQPLRRFAEPAFDAIAVKPYAHFTDPPGPPRPPAPFSIWRGGSVARLDDPVIATFEEIARTAPPGWSLGMGHHLHGRILQQPPGGSPMLRPAGRTTWFLSMNWGDPRQSDANMAWIETGVAALGPRSSPRDYINYLSREDEASVASAYGDGYGRLQDVKRKYDPDNLFRHNRNIRPH